MTQEQKKLLLKDLCARLPYGVIMQVYFEDIAGSGYFDEKAESIDIDPYCPHVNDRWIENIKPYLRPMSSMTEEESKEFALLQTDFYVDGFLYPIAAINMVNWLNAHHFDYCGLIEKGLALEAPEGMYTVDVLN